MTRLLTKHVFTEAAVDLPEIQAFSCGDERWDREVSQWIKSASGDNSVIEDMRQFGTEVWLHRDDRGELVGYSSLGARVYTWPQKSHKKELVNILPFIGIHKRFQGEPADAPRDDRYAYQILDELLVCAAERSLPGGRYPLIVLSVDSDNERAVRFYRRREFFDLQAPRIDKESGITYTRLARDLTDLVAQLRKVAPMQN